MPLIKPKSGEKEGKFMGRCMSNSTMKKEYPKQKQRLAICYSQFRGKGEEDKLSLLNRIVRSIRYASEKEKNHQSR